MDQINKKILIIDDDVAILKSLVYQFKKEGFTVVEGHNGNEGLMLALLEKPDLILLDIMMPEKNGLEMLKDLRDDVWGKNVQVILLSNMSDMDKVFQAVNLGVYDYLVKSDWQLKDVIKTVKKKLEIELVKI